jgi:hypothetical protein
MASLKVFLSHGGRLLRLNSARCCAARQFHYDQVVPVGSQVDKESPEYKVRTVIWWNGDTKSGCPSYRITQFQFQSLTLPFKLCSVFQLFVTVCLCQKAWPCEFGCWIFMLLLLQKCPLQRTCKCGRLQIFIIFLYFYHYQYHNISIHNLQKTVFQVSVILGCLE